MFAYFRDPLFLLGCACYLLNRFWLKAHFSGEFFHSWFNDFWLIPCALPPVLWMHRKLGLRNHDRLPTLHEVFTHLVFWCVLFEIVGPILVPGSTGDKWDVAAYCAGALLAWGFWHRLPQRIHEF